MDSAPAPSSAEVEAAIAVLVDKFYDRARQDPLLAPVFADSIDDWDGHLARIRDFWSRHLNGAPHGGGGRGGFFMMHAVLPIEPAHFDRWLALFGETVAEVLPPALQGVAMGRAKHMADSISAGMFTAPGHRFGRPSA